MTEAEWLAATDPGPKLAFLRNRGGASERKLRLFACARAWGFGQLLARDERCRDAVLTAERFADGLADSSDLTLAFHAAREAWHSARMERPHRHRRRVLAARAAPVDGRAAELACHAANPGWDIRALGGEAHNWESEYGAAAMNAVATIVRDLFNPFVSASSLAPAVLAWDGGTVPKLAQAIYDDRAFDRLPVLADALEDAGYTDSAVLAHCRSGGPHARGCWPLDLVLGKA